MDYGSELQIWNSMSVNIVSVKHGLIFGQSVSEIFENSAFVYAAGKRAEIRVDGVPYSVKSNCLLHVGPNKQIIIEAEELEYFFVTYQAELPPNAGREMTAQLLQKKPFEQFYILRTAKPAFFSEQLTIMADVWAAKEQFAPIRLKACFYSVIHELFSELSAGTARPAEIDTFEYARHYLQQNYAHVCSIQTLSDSIGITRSALHEQFKSKLGIGPQQFLIQLRLDAACRELISGNLTIDEIAASCGLRDKAYFSRIFKQKYGVPPGTFRRENGAGSASDAALYSKRISACKKEQNNEDFTLIENMGRIHRYYGIPRRIVCLDYSAAEICAALGAADSLVGIASAEGSLADCAEAYRPVIAKAPFLPGRSAELDVPSFETVLSRKPDIVIGTGYSFDQYNGVAGAEEFEQNGIHIYALKATYTLGSSFESVYEDIKNLGKILGRDQQAALLVQQMRDREKELDLLTAQYDEPVRVFSFDAVAAGKAITCGQSLENHIITRAGGINIFGDRERQFVSVDWAEVAKADPQAIVVHYFHTQSDGQQKAALLKYIPELEHTAAVRNNRMFIVGVKKVFPGMDCVDTAYSLCKWLHSH